MGFIDSYKCLEKLCGQVFSDSRGVSAYIDEMSRISSRGSFFVKSWDDDFKKLKHYRWIRNKISHEPGCTEQNMCKREDSLWLDEFRSRILNQKDPLSLYRQATKPRPPVKTATRSTAPKKTKTSGSRKSKGNGRFWSILLITSLLVVTAAVLLTRLI